MSLHLKFTPQRIVAGDKCLHVMQESRTKRYYVRDFDDNGGYREWSASTLEILQERVEYTLNKEVSC